MSSPTSVCVFCGARSGHDAKWAKVAQELGRIRPRKPDWFTEGGMPD